MKLSQQAIGALLMTLQKCLSEETDITELLSDWNLSIKNDEVYVDNPPPVYAPGIKTENEKKVFETE
tara:strand:+ start:4626 stop:4826 length:201 start_codon:yes stop_codon:yes gene_type:complete